MSLISFNEEFGEGIPQIIENLKKIDIAGIINDAEYIILQFMSIEYISYFYNLVYFLFVENTKIAISEELIETIKKLSLEEKIIAIEGLKAQHEKMQKIEKKYTIDSDVYYLLALEYPSKVNYILNLPEHKRTRKIEELRKKYYKN
ncbi:hypothetical protein HGA92_00670 [Candidatus Gracilibacteria bacterium]|nr:hypothetical protein [Candidatus Gracilibacteria bacterium]NUJ98878.1 hypothetical protein [Candidatus Gracilibacteria bacterium]